jgi:uncharacterized membrane protein
VSQSGRSLPRAGAFVNEAMSRFGDDRRLDRLVRAVAAVTERLPTQGLTHDVLSGAWLGHTLHPMLTDLPIGCWTSAWLLDLLHREQNDELARQLIGLGILSAIPTVLAGASDWNETTGRARRVGAVHALANTGALALYIGSWDARRRGRHAAGIALAMAGATLATGAGYLGGHLVATLGAGVDPNALAMETPT